MLAKAVLVLLACLSLTARAEGGEPAGKVDLAEGKVQILDAAGKARAVKAGDGVKAGETVVTGPDGELQMAMADGGYVAVRPNTRMSIAAYRAEGDDQDNGIFSLVVGSFRSITGWIGKHNPRNYRINTPTATIGVRGTDHEPLVIPEGSSEGEAGTYDKVNAGASYIQTPHGRVDVAAHKSAFAPRAGTAAPRLLASVPRFFRPTRNERLLEHRHETIQRTLDKRRDERRQAVAKHRAEGGAKPGHGQRPDLRRERQQQRQAVKEARQHRQAQGPGKQQQRAQPRAERRVEKRAEMRAQPRPEKRQERAVKRPEPPQRGRPHRRD